MGNLYGMNIARYTKYPEIKTKGLYAIKKPLCVFTSDKVFLSSFCSYLYEDLT